MKNSKKFKEILSNFVLFLALMFVISGSVDVKAAAPKLNKKKITIYVGHTKKAESKQCQRKSKMGFFPEESCRGFLQRNCEGEKSREYNDYSNGGKQKDDM